MKFIKSSFVQKLIIILIALMIFNIAIPKEALAVDFGGILLQPITWSILGYVVPVDVVLGFVLNGLSAPIGGIAKLIASVVESDSAIALEAFDETLSKIFVGPDTIFSGNIGILNANIFKVDELTDKDVYGDGYKLAETIGVVANPVGYHLILNLKKAISTTYTALRDICGYIMLAGLIWTGIRILLSANSPSKKQQYVSLLQDWFVGMALLIFSHVIMVGVFYISDILSEALKVNLNGFGGINWQLIKSLLLSIDSVEQVIYMTMLIYLIYLTVVFAISYMKRLMWICVLIVFAPVVSIMYVFGNQTKSIYTKWLKEYITTVFVQPFHILVYYILVSVPLNIAQGDGLSLSATSLLEIIYALVAMSFIKPAEKYIRELFGMGKGTLASQASYDSGKKTLDKAVKAITTVAATAATAGVGGAAMAGAKGLMANLAGKNAVLKGAANGLSKEMGLIGKVGEKFLFKSNKNNSVIDNGGTTSDSSAIPENDKEQGTKKTDTTQTNGSNNVEDEGQEEKRQLRRWPARTGDYLGVLTGQKGVFETLANMGSDTKLGRYAGQMMDSNLGQALKRFEELGGMQQLHQGFNEVRGTFSVTGDSNDWQDINDRMTKIVQEKAEQNVYNFTHNSTNKNVVEDHVRKAMEKQYEGKPKPNNYEELVSNKIKKDLKEFADTYVKLGVKTAAEAYECKDLRDKHGLTAQEAVKILRENK